VADLDGSVVKIPAAAAAAAAASSIVKTTNLLLSRTLNLTRAI
jgi:hypothetical protein